MKLYLASYHVPDVQVLTDLIGKPSNQTKVALIPNAQDCYAGLARKFKREDKRTYFRDLGFLVDIVDLLDYTEPEKLRKKLTTYDLIWVIGGNTFILRHEMRRSGFDKIINDVLEDGVVFGGDSAGAAVAGTDLHGIEIADDARFAESVIWKGLALTPHFILPHADNTMFADMADAIRTQRSNDPSLVILNDDQAWVVRHGDAWKITGAKPAHLR
jgi:dipeptidase E